MLKRIVIAVALAMLIAPAAFSQAEQAHPPVYTFVSQFQVPRANWAQWSADSEKNVVPIFKRFMADGTLTSWSTFETLVHTPDGMTHGSAWSSTSLAGITKVLDELRKLAPQAGQLAATKHEDYLMRAAHYHASPVADGSGYLRVVCYVTKPGRGEDFAGTLHKYLGATFDEQLKKGAANYYGLDEQYVNTSSPGMRCLVMMYPNAEAMNSWASAIANTLDKMSPEDRKGWADAIADTTLPDSRRDALMRVTHSAHK